MEDESSQLVKVCGLFSINRYQHSVIVFVGILSIGPQYTTRVSPKKFVLWRHFKHVYVEGTEHIRNSLSVFASIGFGSLNPRHKKPHSDLKV